MNAHQWNGESVPSETLDLFFDRDIPLLDSGVSRRRRQQERGRDEDAGNFYNRRVIPTRFVQSKERAMETHLIEFDL